MNQTNDLLEFNDIIKQLEAYALSDKAKEHIRGLKPYLSEIELKKQLRDTTQGRYMLDSFGTAPLPIMKKIEEYLDTVQKEGLLLPEALEEVVSFLVSIKRLKTYLEKGKEQQINIAYYSDNLILLDEVCEEIRYAIRGGQVDDCASTTLESIRRKLSLLDEKIHNKASQLMKSQKAFMADSFYVLRNNRICVPVKREYKNKIRGTVLDQSATGATLFIEPEALSQLRDEIDLMKIDEELEVRRILFELSDHVACRDVEIRENIRVVATLDFVFAKAKLSQEMEGIEPTILTERSIYLRGAKHPKLDKNQCVPLDFYIEDPCRGVIITGPNTGGKTVSIKTVGLMCLMACSGLHVPCTEARIPMNNLILCDIGDGQNMRDNLSTFSSHICNVIKILKQVTRESLVILDELGSGTDPTEGMGLAIAILEELRQSKCLFLVTTHYPEVKEYGNRYEEIENARMAFDRESLKPLYRLELGKSGESCALYIAKKLGVPNRILHQAAVEAYGDKAGQLVDELGLNEKDGGIHKIPSPKVQYYEPVKQQWKDNQMFQRGDSVVVYPDEKIGIVVQSANDHGEVLVQIQKEKTLINQKRLKLKVKASELYPENYDFSILFDTVENRKLRHQMEKRHQEGKMIQLNQCEREPF